jgi:hypothetical protein
MKNGQDAFENNVPKRPVIKKSKPALVFWSAAVLCRF